MRSRFRPSHGTVVAYLALFIALGGTTYAATGGNFILGKSNSASTPTALSSGAGQALKVTNTTAHGGVWAAGGSVANNTAAVHGQSTYGNAVEGISGKNTASGVYGQNNSTGFGVAGRSTNGVGVMGDSSGGWAMQAFGNATQTRTGNGFVKAMAFVNPYDASDPIKQCFNSQRPPGQATSGDCGIDYTDLAGSGAYNLNFGFQINDRLALAQAVSNAGRTLRVIPASANVLEVDSFAPSPGTFEDTSFYIVVF